MSLKLTENNSKIIIKAVSIIEIMIGLSIPLSFITASLIYPPGRPKVLYGFVVLTSIISVVIGIGLFRFKNWGRKFLIFFAGYIIVTKFLLFANLVEFTGNTIDFMSVTSKDILSFIYHCSILVIFNLKDIRQVLN